MRIKTLSTKLVLLALAIVILLQLTASAYEATSFNTGVIPYTEKEVLGHKVSNDKFGIY